MQVLPPFALYMVNLFYRCTPEPREILVIQEKLLVFEEHPNSPWGDMGNLRR
jgi:hypothetical protein